MAISPCVTHWDLKPVFLVVDVIGHSTDSSLSCGTVIFLLSVGNSFKTSITSVNLRKALVTLFPVQQMHSNFKRSCQIDTRPIKVPQNKFK